MTPTQQRKLRAYLRENPGDLTRSHNAEIKHIWGPRDLPFFRDSFYAHTRLSKVLDEPRFQVPVPQDPSTWEMYFGTRDFADVHQEMRQDFEFNHTYLHGTVAGLIDNAGERGNLVAAFDPFHLPVIAVTAKADYTFAGQDPKTPDWEVDTSMAKHPTDPRLTLAKVKVLSLQWWTEPTTIGEHTFACFSQMLTPGGTWRTSPWGNQSSAEAILIAFMLVSRDLRMLERSETTVQGSPIPPKVKAQVKRKDRLSTVTVVNLRKPMRDQLADVREVGAGGGHHLQHRFVVRGHWRLQPVGPGRTERRLTYIAPYVKGRPEMPFLHQDKVLKW